MQYPIIDLMTDAYINNGWTGLELTYGKNLVDSSHANSGLLSVTVGSSINSVIPSARYSYSDPVNCINGVAISVKSNNLYYFDSIYINLYNNDTLESTISHVFTNINDVFTYVVDPNMYEKLCLIYGAPSGNVVGTNINGVIQIENGNVITPYEPYHAPDTDIANRLKLPLPHYFLHPVIDALQRAAAGTQTADDTEILQHYLTPLGIGGI